MSVTPTPLNTDGPFYEIWAQYGSDNDAWYQVQPTLTGPAAASLMVDLTTPSDFVQAGMIVVRVEYTDGVRTATVL